MSSAHYRREHALVSDELLRLSREMDVLVYRAIQNMDAR